MARIILDLCGGTGAWSAPYREAGYDVRVVTLPEQDVRTYIPPWDVHGILAAPPCTEFAVSGARWWAGKPSHLLEEALEVVNACTCIIKQADPEWWALENPVGRLRRYIGPPAWTFQPWEYGDPWLKKTCVWGTARQPDKAPVAVAPLASAGFKKRGGKYKNRQTAINAASNSRHNNPGEFMRMLVKEGYVPSDWIHHLGPSPHRATLRSITPPGFARAFFEANQ